MLNASFSVRAMSDPRRRYKLPLPPTGNHRLMPVKMGKGLRLIKTPKMRAWEKEAAELLQGEEALISRKGYRLSLQIWWPDRRRRDIDGPVKSVFDALVRAGILEDDSLIKYFDVETPVSPYSLDDIEPGVDITITTVEDWELPI